MINKQGTSCCVSYSKEMIFAQNKGFKVSHAFRYAWIYLLTP